MHRSGVARSESLSLGLQREHSSERTVAPPDESTQKPKWPLRRGTLALVSRPMLETKQSSLDGAPPTPDAIPDEAADDRDPVFVELRGIKTHVSLQGELLQKAINETLEQAASMQKVVSEVCSMERRRDETIIEKLRALLQLEQVSIAQSVTQVMNSKFDDLKTILEQLPTKQTLAKEEANGMDVSRHDLRQKSVQRSMSTGVHTDMQCTTPIEAGGVPNTHIIGGTIAANNVQHQGSIGMPPMLIGAPLAGPTMPVAPNESLDRSEDFELPYLLCVDTGTVKSVDTRRRSRKKNGSEVRSCPSSRSASTATHQVFDECHVPDLDIFDGTGKIESVSASERTFGFRFRQVETCMTRALPCCKGYTNGMLSSFVNSRIFKAIRVSAIVFNYAFIVYRSDYKIKHLRQEESGTLVVMQYCFTAYYLIEVVLQILNKGLDYFIGADSAWNRFDFGVVILAVSENIMAWLGASMVNTSFIRIVRLFKISKALRMFTAVRVFKEIRVMVDALVGSFTLFMFCLLIFGIFLSVFAIVFVQAATTFLETKHDIDPDLASEINTNFGSVSDCMLALFKAATGGTDWGSLHDLSMKFGEFYGWLFLAFISAHFIAVASVITGTFCEKAIHHAAPTTDELIQQRHEQEVSDAKELFGLITNATYADDEQGPRSISAMQFAQLMADPEIQIYFLARGLKPTSAMKLFTTLCDIYKTDRIDFITLVSAFVKLDGVASSVDMHCFSVRQLYHFFQIKKAQKAQHGETLEMYASLTNQIAALRSVVQTYMPESQSHQAAACKPEARQRTVV